MQIQLLTRIVVVLWAALAFWPFRSWLLVGVSRDSVAMFGLYATGCLFLVLALRRDDREDLLKSLLGKKSSWALLCLMLIMLQLAFDVSMRTFKAATLTVGMVGFALWGLSKDEDAIIRHVGRLLSLGAVILFLAIAGEMFFRMPSVQRRTGGNSPGLRLWEQDKYDRVWEGNENHWRSLHTDREKNDGVMRIVTLGDSFTWGDKIGATEDTWPYRLEHSLREDGYSVEVVNLAQLGYTTVNEAEALRRFGWGFQPDLVILQMLINDSLPSGPDFQREMENWHWNTCSLLPGELHQYFDGRSYFYSFLNSRFRQLQIGLFHPQGYEPLFESSFAGWQECQAALQEMSNAAKDRTTPLLAVQFPILVGDLREDQYPHRVPHQKMLEAARAADLPSLDLLPVFAAEEKIGRKWWALPCDSHPNVHGHGLAAGAIADQLLELGLLQEPDRD